MAAENEFSAPAFAPEAVASGPPAGVLEPPLPAELASKTPRTCVEWVLNRRNPSSVYKRFGALRLSRQ
jgi:hypothetical protein